MIEKLKINLIEKLKKGIPIIYGDLPDDLIENLSKEIEEVSVLVKSVQNEGVLGKKDLENDLMGHSVSKKTSDWEKHIIKQEDTSQMTETVQNFEENESSNEGIEIEVFRKIGYRKLVKLVEYLSTNVGDLMYYCTSKSLFGVAKFSQMKEAAAKFMQQNELGVEEFEKFVKDTFRDLEVDDKGVDSIDLFSSLDEFKRSFGLEQLDYGAVFHSIISKIQQRTMELMTWSKDFISDRSRS